MMIRLVKIIVLNFSVFSLAIPLGLLAQRFRLPPLETFIPDTLYITVQQDSNPDTELSRLQVLDFRDHEGDIPVIRQIENGSPNMCYRGF